MLGTFIQARAFNQDISGWNTRSSTSMVGMFSNANEFNQNIGGWDVSNVENMNGMFRNATVFNQDISNWDVSKVTDLSKMFENARAFDQDIRKWNLDFANENSFFKFSDMFKGANAMLTRYPQLSTNQGIYDWFTQTDGSYMS